MLSLSSLVALLSIASRVVAGVVQTQSQDFNGHSPRTTYWFAFGDSYTTTGFDPTGTLPTPGNPLGNPAFPGETGGGGENFVGFDTVTYNKSLILTYDYAAGGATINATLVAPITLALPDEVDDFLDVSAPWKSEDSLFSVWIGINDIGNTFYLDGDRSAFSDVLLDDYFAQVQRLYDAGGRNFLFINVPPTYRAPLLVSFFSPAQLLTGKSVINTFNAKMAAKVKAFKAQNRGVTTWTYDSYSTFTCILDDPTAYGLSANVTGFGDAGQFWGNSYHPSSDVHHILAKQISQQLRGTPWF
ncbi:fungal cellulose binding domain-containing protein [Mycena filopes]|nr:fungal cellulose binding domain-containing protein [Mycena filopes]